MFHRSGKLKENNTVKKIENRRENNNKIKERMIKYRCNKIIQIYIEEL